MLAIIIIIFSILSFFCTATLIIGIIDNAGETKVMSLRTYLRLCKDRRIFDLDQAMGVGYYREIDNRKDWAVPRWTWHPIFATILIGGAIHKDVI